MLTIALNKDLDEAGFGEVKSYLARRCRGRYMLVRFDGRHHIHFDDHELGRRFTEAYGPLIAYQSETN